MRNKNVMDEANDIHIASELIQLGARLQMLEIETKLSREKLLRLYKEVRGKSPPKGMLPFSTDWFITWQPNAHASLYMAYYNFLRKHTALHGLQLIIKAYRMYLDQNRRCGLDDLLTITRAWTMVRFFEAKMLQVTECKKCGGNFVTHTHELTENYVCGLCHVPARAGKTRRQNQQNLINA